MRYNNFYKKRGIKMKSLKIYKKAVLLMMTGGLVLTGCKKQSETEFQQQTIIELKSMDKNNFISDAPKKQEPKKGTYYTKKSVNIKKTPLSTKNIKKITPYQKIKVLKNENKWSLIKSGKTTGYIKKKDIGKISGKYVEVDISKQKLKIYKNDKKILETKVVTGLDTDPDRKTVRGCFKVYNKERNRTLVGKNYRTPVNYWMPFYKAYGMHDAYWRSEFGGEIYKSSGSHGCVNLPKEIAPKVYKKINVGTPVLIHD